MPRRAPEVAAADAALDTAAAISAAAFRAAIRAFLRTSERAAVESGLTPQRYLLLLMIKGASDGSERATLADLAERLQLAESSTSELVTRAEEAALIERKRWPMDTRVVHVYLTHEGERRLARAFRSLGEERRKLREIIAALDEESG